MDKKAQYFIINRGKRNEIIIPTNDISSVVNATDEGKCVIVRKSTSETIEVQQSISVVASFLPDVVAIEEVNKAELEEAKEKAQ